jgi:predicted ATPase
MSTAPDHEVAEPEVQAKLPFLRRVRIRGYKSIAFCDVTLEPLTILVGRNASGKSNFVDALAFLRDVMEMRATEAVNERGGWRSILCRDGRAAQVEMGLEATVQSRGSPWDADYSFALRIGKQNQVFIERERLLLRERMSGRTCGFKVADKEVEWTGTEHFEDDSDWTSEEELLAGNSNDKLDRPHLFARRRYDRLLLSLIGSQPFIDLGEGLRSSCVYNFSPSAIRTLQLITAAPGLEPDGRNLGRAIEALKEIDPSSVQRIGQYLSVMVEGVEHFQTIAYGDYETVQFRVAGASGSPPRQFDASSMSDGTLRTLAALVAAKQIRLPVGPGFVAIEEPETSLHPGAMRALVDALDEATLRTQILLTTHSAEMLDNPTIRQENIRVVEMTDGQTMIAPVDEASVEIVRRNLNTLGGLERDNQLQADLDDLDRQRQLSRNGQEPKA